MSFAKKADLIFVQATPSPSGGAMNIHNLRRWVEMTAVVLLLFAAAGAQAQPSAESPSITVYKTPT